jgi:hypothetical protein
MSRPKGSKNKPKAIDNELEIKKDNTLLVNLFGTPKEIKLEIKRLRRLKRECRSGTPERINLHRKIKELQEQLKGVTIIDKDKQPLIQEIYRLDPLIEEMGMDLTRYTVEELQKHIDIIKRKRGI